MKMRGSDQKNILIVMMVVTVAATVRGEDGFVTWGDNYYTTWGHPALVINETSDSELQLTLDHKSGSGFESYKIYGSGSFNIRIKAPQTKSTKVTTSFYLRSKSSRNDGLCFQIFGNGPAYLLNTIIFVYGEGDKYQRFRLWFDPTKDYHSYRFLWNPYQVVFYVDDTAIRVYKKNPDIYYPSVQTMFMHGSVENGTMVDLKEMSYCLFVKPFKLNFRHCQSDTSKFKAELTNICSLQQKSKLAFILNTLSESLYISLIN
ncbi:unnamed protein product [Brassica oleracea var. botrytis]